MSHPPLVTAEVEFMPCSSIMLYSVLEGFVGTLAFFFPLTAAAYLGYDGYEFQIDGGIVRLLGKQKQRTHARASPDARRHHHRPQRGGNTRANQQQQQNVDGQRSTATRTIRACVHTSAFLHASDTYRTVYTHAHLTPHPHTPFSSRLFCSRVPQPFSWSPAQ